MCDEGEVLDGVDHGLHDQDRLAGTVRPEAEVCEGALRVGIDQDYGEVLPRR